MARGEMAVCQATGHGARRDGRLPGNGSPDGQVLRPSSLRARTKKIVIFDHFRHFHFICSFRFVSLRCVSFCFLSFVSLSRFITFVFVFRLFIHFIQLNDSICLFAHLRHSKLRGHAPPVAHFVSSRFFRFVPFVSLQFDLKLQPCLVQPVWLVPKPP